MQSRLGTKDYWDSFYNNELLDQENSEIWFGKRTQAKIVEYLVSNYSKETTICDIGTGNGVLLNELYRHGYTNLIGIDYSEASVELAESVCAETPIKFMRGDVRSEKLPQAQVYHDKGTFDAISLGERVEDYERQIIDAVCKGSKFILTSCNFTASELSDRLARDNVVVKSIIDYPKISFGGVEGSQTSTILCELLK